LRPETLRRIHHLQLRVRDAVEGTKTGLHRSPYRGQSVEFLQHREYVRGDDLRRVDWKVWGRQDRLTVKEYEEETNLRLTLLVDGSASMDYAGDAAPVARPSKFDHAATLAASLAWLALSRGDAVGCGVFDDRLRASVPARTRRSQLDGICGVLEAPRNAGAGDLLRVVRDVADALPPRGLVILLSDLFGDRADLMRGLRLVRGRGHDVAVLHVMDDDELDFPFDGPTRFEGLELPGHIACNPRALRAGYMAALADFLADVRKRAAAARCDYSLIRTGEPVDAALVKFLSRRSSMAV
jgi:uncharacterized protein (DUF58 family)